MGQIVLDTDVVSRFYKGTLPAEVQQHMVGHRSYIAFATAGELSKWVFRRHWAWAKRTALRLWLERSLVLPYDLEVAWIWGGIAG
jgi:predicted nucleic acid-binding protein